ncbi:MAG: preprotein translocase subunit SecG [Pseudomonadota bacterium]
MESIVIVIHILVALAIIGLILLQQGKGAEAGASFGGGASQTVFGSQGGGNFFAKLTAILAFVFFVTSFSLAIIAKNKATGNINTAIEGVPTVEQVAPQVSDVPVVESINDTESEVPVVAPQETLPAVEQGSDVPQLDN